MVVLQFALAICIIDRRYYEVRPTKVYENTQRLGGSRADTKVRNVCDVFKVLT